MVTCVFAAPVEVDKRNARAETTHEEHRMAPAIATNGSRCS
jgi:hypothetical protein